MKLLDGLKPIKPLPDPLALILFFLVLAVCDVFLSFMLDFVYSLPYSMCRTDVLLLSGIYMVLRGIWIAAVLYLCYSFLHVLREVVSDEP